MSFGILKVQIGTEFVLLPNTGIDPIVENLRP